MWPNQVPILDAKDISSEASPLAVILDTFPPQLVNQVTDQFALALNFYHRKSVVRFKGNVLRAFIFNLTMSILGYTNGQDKQTLLLAQEYHAHKKLRQDNRKRRT